MRAFALITAVVVLAGSTSAKAAPAVWGWVPIDGAVLAWAMDGLPDGPTKGKATMARFVALATPNTGKPSEPFDGMFQQLEFDCSARTYRIEGGVYIDRNFNVVGGIEPEEHRGTNRDMSEFALMAIACDGEHANGQRYTTDLRGVAEAFWAEHP